MAWNLIWQFGKLNKSRSFMFVQSIGSQFRPLLNLKSAKFLKLSIYQIKTLTLFLSYGIYSLTYYIIICTLCCSDGILVCANHEPADTSPLIHTLITAATTILINIVQHVYNCRTLQEDHHRRISVHSTKLFKPATPIYKY